MASGTPPGTPMMVQSSTKVLAYLWEILSRVVCGWLADFPSGGDFGVLYSVYKEDTLNHAW